jgi:UPF0271 protein
VSIDLNADVGEGLDDAGLLPYVTSANVACGLHAGDPGTMEATVILALARGVRIGAHPGFPNREAFGRVRVEMSADAIESLVLYQISALDGFVRSRGAALTHVKPHGALYHSGAEFPDVARAIAEAVRRFGSSLVLVGPPDSMLMEAGREAGLPVAAEGFADRRYLPDGTLVPRGWPGAVLTDPQEAAEQAVALATDGIVRSEDGSPVTVHADTICIHGDNPSAISIARSIRSEFTSRGIDLAPFERRLRPDRQSAAV